MRNDTNLVFRWEYIVNVLQKHCENQNEAMRNPAKVEATGDIIAILFNVDRVALAEQTLRIVTQKTPPLQNSWGYRLYQWINEQ